jgi:hypothetical protein
MRTTWPYMRVGFTDAMDAECGNRQLWFAGWNLSNLRFVDKYRFLIRTAQTLRLGLSLANSQICPRRFANRSAVYFHTR